MQDTVYCVISRDIGKEDSRSWPKGFEELVDEYMAESRMEILKPFGPRRPPLRRRS